MAQFDVADLDWSEEGRRRRRGHALGIKGCSVDRQGLWKDGGRDSGQCR